MKRKYTRKDYADGYCEAIAEAGRIRAEINRRLEGLRERLAEAERGAEFMRLLMIRLDEEQWKSSRTVEHTSGTVRIHRMEPNWEALNPMHDAWKWIDRAKERRK